MILRSFCTNSFNGGLILVTLQSKSFHDNKNSEEKRENILYDRLPTPPERYLLLCTCVCIYSMQDIDICLRWDLCSVCVTRSTAFGLSHWERVTVMQCKPCLNGPLKSCMNDSTGIMLSEYADVDWCPDSVSNGVATCRLEWVYFCSFLSFILGHNNYNPLEFKTLRLEV